MPSTDGRPMRRIERLINLIAALLETERPMTAEEIRTSIAGYDQASHEAFRRAFERDKEALRAMGIPLELRSTDPFAETADAYIIPKARYYLPEPDLEPDEIAALRIAADAVLGAGEEAEAGLMKLSLDATSSPWTGPRVVWGADLAAEEPNLGPLYSAILDRTPVSFDYEGARSGEATRRAIEPYGLVHRRGHWYVVGRDTRDGETKSFKLSRFSGRFEVGDGTYDVPEGFDAASHLAGESWEIGDRQETAVVRFDAPMAWWAEQNLPEAPSRAAPEGALDVELPVANVDAFISWVIGFGGGVEIVSPESARARLVAHLAPFAGESA